MQLSKSKNINLSIQNLLIEIKKWYNGYLFTESLDNTETVYNPFSILNFFKNIEFKNYWFKTGTLSYLIKLLNQYNYNIPKDENNIYLTMYELDKFEIDRINLISLLFQAGYLTIESYDKDNQELKLKYPNEEVRNLFNDQIQEIITSRFNELVNTEKNNLKLYLKNEDWENLFELFKGFYAEIPYTERRSE